MKLQFQEFRRQHWRDKLSDQHRVLSVCDPAGRYEDTAMTLAGAHTQVFAVGADIITASGSDGMFVSAARFVSKHQKNPSSELSIHGVEKTDETGRFCRMNFAARGLEGDIRHGGKEEEEDQSQGLAR